MLRARYFPSCDLLDARLGVKPSYTWRSLHGVFDVIRKGTRWVIGNGESVHVDLSRWLLQPSSFQPLLLGNSIEADLLVAQLIDKQRGVCREELVRRVLMATSIWEASKFDRKLWQEAFPSVLECVWQAKEVLDGDELG